MGSEDLRDCDGAETSGTTAGVMNRAAATEEGDVGRKGVLGNGDFPGFLFIYRRGLAVERRRFVVNNCRMVLYCLICPRIFCYLHFSVITFP